MGWNSDGTPAPGSRLDRYYRAVEALTRGEQPPPGIPVWLVALGTAVVFICLGLCTIRGIRSKQARQQSKPDTVPSNMVQSDDETDSDEQFRITFTEDPEGSSAVLPQTMGEGSDEEAVMLSHRKHAAHQH